MITIRTVADITADRQVTVNLPPETPIGKAELVVTVAPHEKISPLPGALRRRFGAVQSGDAHAADNGRIDADLYGSSDNDEQ